MYQQTFHVAKGQHAVERNRQLVAQVLGYAIDGPAEFGLRLPTVANPEWLPSGDYVVLLHATSRDDKLWKEPNWVALGRELHQRSLRCILPWGGDAERQRSLRLAAQIPDAITPPRLNLDQAAALLGGAKAVVGVDTGLAHLAAALDVPTVGIYTATDPTLTGLYAGPRAINLGNIGQAPSVTSVLNALRGMDAC